MKSHKPRPALRSQLLAYSAAAGALAALPSRADAQAITNLTVNNFTGAFSAMRNDGPTGSFLIGTSYTISLRADTGLFVSTSGGYASFNAHVQGADKFAGGNEVTRLAKGDAVAGLGDTNGFLANQIPAKTRVNGHFVPTGTASWKSGYIAFQAGSYQGWVGVAVHNNAGFHVIDEVEFVDPDGDGIYGAYGIGLATVGETGVSPVPEPASAAAGLGLLALGAAGIREHRRRKQRVA